MTSFWWDPIIEKVRQCAPAPCFVVFPQYRPDLTELLSTKLGFSYKDFRHDVLKPLGWSAGEAPLTLLDKAIMCAGDGSPGLVLANIEALLSAKPEEERRRWLASMSFLSPPRSVVLPLTLYGSSLANDVKEQVLILSDDDLPALEMRRCNEP